MFKSLSFDSTVRLGLFIFSLALIYFTRDFPFYWDNIVQLSVPANYYYDTNFTSFYLPDDIATGHPTFVGMYFAGLWKIFGRTLLVSHLAMLPFVFGLLNELFNLTKNIGVKEKVLTILMLFFVVIDTTFLAQLSLITFDIIQLWLFFLSLNLLIKEKKLALSISFMALMLISLRGAMMAGGLFLFTVVYAHNKHNKIKWKALLPYTFGICALSLFLLLFKINKGWMIHNTVSNKWAEASSYASFSEMVRNTGIFAWRLIDFGRVGFFLVLVFMVLKMLSQNRISEIHDQRKSEALKHKTKKPIQLLLWVAITQAMVFLPILIIYTNPFGHRYLLPIMITVNLCVVYWVYHSLTKKWLVLGILFLILGSGHFWLYPPKIAQGWDATTLHWQYFKGQEKMKYYVENKKIPTQEIQTFFPAYYPYQLSYLSEKREDFDYNKEFPNATYILFSNAFNVSDGIIDGLSSSSKYTLIHKEREGRIIIELYKKRSE